MPILDISPFSVEIRNNADRVLTQRGGVLTQRGGLPETPFVLSSNPDCTVTGPPELMVRREIVSKSRFEEYDDSDDWAIYFGFAEVIRKPFFAGDPADLSQFTAERFSGKMIAISDSEIVGNVNSDFIRVKVEFSLNGGREP